MTKVYCNDDGCKFYTETDGSCTKDSIDIDCCDGYEVFEEEE